MPPSETIWAREIWVNIGSVNGLLPDGTKSSPEPMSAYRRGILLHSFERNVMHEMRKNLIILNMHSGIKIKIVITYPRAQWVHCSAILPTLPLNIWLND